MPGSHKSQPFVYCQSGASNAAFEFVGTSHWIWWDPRGPRSMGILSFTHRLAEAQLRMESQLQEVDTEGLKLDEGSVSRAMRIRLNVGEDQVSAVTEDVSGGGLFVRTDAPFRVGQVMDVDVVHPQTFANIRCRAAVRWVGSKQGKNGIGLELIADDIEEARLGAFLSTGQFPALPPEEQP